MSLFVQFYSVIIPLEKIKTCESVGGLMGILELKKDAVGGRIYFDDYLYRDGAMGPGDVEDIVKFWEGHGLVGIAERDGAEYWKDLCVVDMFGGPTLPCDWLEFEALIDEEGRRSHSFVYRKGTEPGKLIKPNSYTK